MDWNPIVPTYWLAQFERLKKYLVKHKKAPALMSTNPLGAWLDRQKKKYLKGQLSALQIEMLAAITPLPADRGSERLRRLVGLELLVPTILWLDHEPRSPSFLRFRSDLVSLAGKAAESPCQRHFVTSTGAQAIGPTQKIFLYRQTGPRPAGNSGYSAVASRGLYTGRSLWQIRHHYGHFSQSESPVL
jgi:hypothetical protein